MPRGELLETPQAYLSCRSELLTPDYTLATSENWRAVEHDIEEDFGDLPEIYVPDTGEDVDYRVVAHNRSFGHALFEGFMEGRGPHLFIEYLLEDRERKASVRRCLDFSKYKKRPSLPSVEIKYIDGGFRKIWTFCPTNRNWRDIPVHVRTTSGGILYFDYDGKSFMEAYFAKGRLKVVNMKHGELVDRNTQEKAKEATVRLPSASFFIPDNDGAKVNPESYRFEIGRQRIKMIIENPHHRPSYTKRTGEVFEEDCFMPYRVCTIRIGEQLGLQRVHKENGSLWDFLAPLAIDTQQIRDIVITPGFVWRRVDQVLPVLFNMIEPVKQPQFALPGYDLKSLPIY